MKLMRGVGLIMVLIFALWGVISCENSRQVGPSLMEELKGFRMDRLVSDLSQRLKSKAVFSRKLLDGDGDWDETKDVGKNVKVSDKTERKIVEGKAQVSDAKREEMMEHPGEAKTTGELNFEELQVEGNGEPGQEVQENREIQESAEGQPEMTFTEEHGREGQNNKPESKLGLIEVNLEGKGNIEEEVSVEENKGTDKKPDHNKEDKFQMEEFEVDHAEKGVFNLKTGNIGDTIETNEQKKEQKTKERRNKEKKPTKKIQARGSDELVKIQENTEMQESVNDQPEVTIPGEYETEGQYKLSKGKVESTKVSLKEKSDQRQEAARREDHEDNDMIDEKQDHNDDKVQMKQLEVELAKQGSIDLTVEKAEDAIKRKELKQKKERKRKKKKPTKELQAEENDELEKVQEKTKGQKYVDLPEVITTEEYEREGQNKKSTRKVNSMEAHIEEKSDQQEEARREEHKVDIMIDEKPDHNKKKKVEVKDLEAELAGKDSIDVTGENTESAIERNDFGQKKDEKVKEKRKKRMKLTKELQTQGNNELETVQGNIDIQESVEDQEVILTGNFTREGQNILSKRKVVSTETGFREKNGRREEARREEHKDNDMIDEKPDHTEEDRVQVKELEVKLAERGSIGKRNELKQKREKTTERKKKKKKPTKELQAEGNDELEKVQENTKIQISAADQPAEILTEKYDKEGQKKKLKRKVSSMEAHIEEKNVQQEEARRKDKDEITYETQDDNKDNGHMEFGGELAEKDSIDPKAENTEDATKSNEFEQKKEKQTIERSLKRKKPTKKKKQLKKEDVVQDKDVEKGNEAKIRGEDKNKATKAKVHDVEQKTEKEDGGDLQHSLEIESPTNFMGKEATGLGRYGEDAKEEEKMDQSLKSELSIGGEKAVKNTEEGIVGSEGTIEQVKESDSESVAGNLTSNEHTQEKGQGIENKLGRAENFSKTELSQQNQVLNEGVGEKKEEKVEPDSQFKKEATALDEGEGSMQAQAENPLEIKPSITIVPDENMGERLSGQSQDSDVEEYGDLLQEFSDLPAKFQDTAERVAGHLAPDLQKLTDTSKVYFNMANKQIAESFSPLIGRHYAPLLASVISYTLVFLPLIVVIYLCEHVRTLLSLQKVILLINLYLAAYFATLLVATFIIGSEPMTFFYKNSLTGYIYLQLLQALGYLVYLIMQTFNVLSACSLQTFPSKLTAVVQLVIAVLVGLHVYVTIFHRAMAMKAPLTGWKIYGIYSFCFFVLCLFARIKQLKKDYAHLGDESTDKRN